MAEIIDPQQADQAQSLQEATTAVASGSSRPTAHAQRYDRQLRLWASSGQASLESSSVLLIGATHLGAQSLKNLILPGIGSFTVLDGQMVGEYDVGNNFFLEAESSYGEPRAQEVARCLAELNPSVKGRAVCDDPARLLSSDPSFFSQFTLIIAANQPPHVLLALSDLCWSHATPLPLISVRGAGMIGSVRVQIKELGIIETHPASTVDLRLTSPWPELEAFAQGYDVQDRDAMAHGHIPYIVILLRKLAEWRQEHRELPVPSKDRKAFAQNVDVMRDKSVVDTENFDEAVAALGQAVWRPIASGRKVPAEVEALFDDPACATAPTPGTTNFWLLVRALRAFTLAEGHLPLPGSLPDFKATSATYVALQRLYKDKARRDVAALRVCLGQVLQEAGLPGDAVPSGEIEAFAKNASYIKLIRGRNLRDLQANPNKDAVPLALMDPVNPPTVQHHIAFEAIDAFYASTGRFPGSSKGMTDSLIGRSHGAGASHSMSTSSSAASLGTRDDDYDGEPDKKRQRSDSPFVATNGAGVGADTGADAEMKTATPQLSENGEAREGVGEDDDDDDEGTPPWREDLATCLALLDGPGGILARWGLPRDPAQDGDADADDDDDDDEPSGATLVRKSVRELVRSGHGDVASTASFLGGIVGQEAIKVITRQYVPVGAGSGVVLYDGVRQCVGAMT